MINYSTIDRYRSGDRDAAVLSPRTTSQVRQSEICEIPKPIKGFSLVRSKSESRFTRDNFFSHSQSNRILPGRLIHKYSDERRKAIRRSTSAKTLEAVLERIHQECFHDLSAAILVGLAMVDHPSFWCPKYQKSHYRDLKLFMAVECQLPLKTTKH